MCRPARDTRKSIDVFIARKAEIDVMLERIAKLSEDHSGADPDKVNWGDVGTLEDNTRHLRRITDAAFSEGEHAEQSLRPTTPSTRHMRGARGRRSRRSFRSTNRKERTP